MRALNSIKSKFKKSRIFYAWQHLKNRSTQPFKLSSFLYPYTNYSDFFIYSSKINENIFIAENIFSFLDRKQLKVTHEFNFYDDRGVFIDTYKCETNKYILKIKFPKYKSNSQYLSFTHLCKKNIDQPLSKKSKKILKNSSSVPHHRGYQIFKKDRNSLGSIVHGNFGALTSGDEIKMSAKQRIKKFCFTSVYKFEKNNLYHLVFNNPTNTLLNISIHRSSINIMNDKPLKIFKINSLGNYVFELSKYEGLLSYISNMPVCRPMIFKNPSSDQTDFDVFHA